MFHPDTQFLIDLWRGLAHAPGVRGGVPDRADFQPEALRGRLARTLLAEGVGEAAVVRLAGEEIQALHGAVSLAGRRLASLWRAESRPLALSATAQAVREGRPVVVVALAGGPDETLEVAVAPLRGSKGAIDRLLVLYSRAGVFPAGSAEQGLVARVSVGVGKPGRPSLSLAAGHGRVA